MDIQQDNVGVNNANMPLVEDNAGTNNMNLQQIKHDNGPKVIRTRLGQISYRPQRLGIVEEQ